MADAATVSDDGIPLAAVPQGSLSRPSRTHVDDRGEVKEPWDDRWGFHPDPVSFVHTCTILPGRAKGWGLHRLHEDRYFLVEGRMEIVCYDVRPDSPTCGQVSRIRLSKENPRMVTIPRFVWHANLNIGEGTVRVLNVPTIPYDHASPDKPRLPLDTPLIPYRIAGATDW